MTALVGRILLLGIVLSLLVWSPAADAATDLHSLVRQVAGKNSTVFVVDEADRVLVNANGARAFIPASTIKVLTALMAIHHLGPEYRFQTRFAVDRDELVIRGTGDPFLVSEELELIAVALARRLGDRQLAGVVIDDSFFAPGLRIPGVGRTWNPYDAPNSATAVNFNTIGVLRRNGKIISAEAQTPLTPHALALATPLQFRKGLRFQIGGNPSDVRRYVGELFAAKLREVGIQVGPGVRGGVAGSGAQPLYVHQNTLTLAEVCARMLESSNNFMANQIFLAIGAAIEGEPASLAKSRRAAQRFIADRPDLRGLNVVEGSGLAYENRATGAAMVALLERFAPYRELMRNKRGTQHKTGTLKAIATLVGYLETAEHGTVRYAIAVPGGGHTRRWRVVETLKKRL